MPRFDLVAYTGGLVKTRDIPIPLVVELTGIDIPKQKIPVRFEHKSNQGVGHTEKIGVIGTELFAAGVISRDTVWSRDVKKSAVNGFPWQISMGGPIHEAEYVPAGQKVTVNGQTFEGELYVVRKMTLKEISFVDLGADSNTYAIVEAQFDERDTLEMNETTTAPQTEKKTNENVVPVQELQLTATTPALPTAARADHTHPTQVATTGTPQTVQSQPSQPEIKTINLSDEWIRQHQQNMLIESRRVAAIEKIGDGKFPDLEAQAIADGWSLEKFRGELQAKAMPDASKIPISGATQNALKPTTLEAIALTTSGISVQFLQTHYEPQTLEAADKYRGIGIQEFCELSCGGKYLPKFRRDARGWLEAAFSSASLPGILSNIANKVLLEGFLTMDDTWRKIVKIASIDGLTKAELAFSEQERVEGRPLGIPASILLVPPALKVLAETIMKSLTVNESTDPKDPKPVNNPHTGKYELVSSPYLASKAFPGNSATDWYLFANPLRLPALEVAFLGGQDRPTVERADADFNVLGIQFRGYIDFGVREQDWRGALKMKP